MLQLTEEYNTVISELRQVNVLKDVDPQWLKDKIGEGAAVNFCADGNQHPEFWCHLNHSILGANCQARGTKELILHNVSLNGGPLMMTLRPELDGLVAEQHLIDGCKMKGLNSIILSVHAACGIANLYHLSFPEIIARSLYSRRRFEIKGFETIPLCHIAYGKNNRNTYYISETKFTKWVQATGPSMPDWLYNFFRKPTQPAVN